MRHARSANRNHGAARNHGFAGIIQRAVAAVGRPADIDLAPADREIAIGVDTVPRRVDLDDSAGNMDIRALRGAKHISAKASKAAAVVPSGRIQAVVAGYKRNFSVRNVNGQSFNALVALRDRYHTAADGYRVIGMHAVVAGGDGIRASCDSQVAIAMQRVIGGINDEGSAMDGQIACRFYALGAGGVILRGAAFLAAEIKALIALRVLRGIGAAASCQYGKIAVLHRQIGPGA